MLNKKNTISALCMLMAMLMVLLSVSMPVSAESERLTADSTAQIPVNPEDKIDSALKEKMSTASPEEKIPVAIWYTDVDQAEIDTLTAEKVGFSAEEVVEDYEMPSTTLLNNLKKGQDGADAQMQAYLERTQKQRESERKKTDEYIMTRREFSRAKYNEKSTKLIKDIQLNEADITFNSQYAPMIIAELTSSQLDEACKKSAIYEMNYYPEQIKMDCTSNTIKEYMGLNKVINKMGLSGENVKIGSVEMNGYPELDCEELVYERIYAVGNATPGSHVTNTARILVGRDNGFAPEAELYCSDSDYEDIESLISNGVSVINVSFAWKYKSQTSDSEYSYSTQDKWFDHIVSQHNITIVSAAGNYANSDDFKRVVSPAMGHNVIAVGAFNDNNTVNLNDDVLWGDSNYINRKTSSASIGCEKPDVIISHNILSGGTSSATPVLTGIIANIIELKPSLAVYPSVIKAIVLASCHRKVGSSNDNEPIETMVQGITERQGAGVPDAFIMASIVSQGTYGVGRFNSSSTQAIRRFMLPMGNTSNDPTNMNVSVTWLKENNFDDGVSHNSSTSLDPGDDVNLDLYIYRYNQLVGSSKIGTVNDKKSSTEMAYVPLSSSQWNYEIRILKASTTTETVRYGYAYSTDKSYIAPTSEEGIYYIRNYYSDKYLTLNSNNEAVMENFTGGEAQQWVIKGTPGHYELCPAFANEETKINFGAKVGSNPYYKAVVGSGNINLSMRSWETDISLEPDAYLFTSVSGGSNNILSYTSSTGVFVRSTGAPVINSYRMWVLEDINYRPGDMDYNGILDVTDATKIGLYIAGSGTYKNIQSVLLDFNCDGVVNVTDTTDLKKHIAGLPY
ncbi:MAG: S8 family serine peptidase [Ruminococcus sp.]|nr:S8 family serine peptidase [Ruminococcus sp.]